MSGAEAVVGPLTALVVEDSATQRQHMVAVMRGLGFSTVHEARDGLEALRLIDAGPSAIHLLVTDIDMPGMDGIALIGQLGQRPQVSNLVVTSARDPRLLETVESVAAAHPQLRLLGTVAKPVTADRMARMWRAVGEAPLARSGGPAGPGPASPADLALALARGEFVPFVQPKVSLADGRLAGAEVLARWQHPVHGCLGPQHFIPVLEGTTLMARFTLAMVEQALGCLRGWQRSMPDFRLSLNLSADDLASPAFVDQLVALVERHGVAPRALTWEVTETMVLNPASLASVARLRLQGFGLSMDDYGIGYSSMQTLSRSPFTELKIDRSFVDGASERSNRRAVLCNAIELAQHLGITSVAEGVEQLADWKLLQELRCDIAQGYLIARPMPCAELLGWTRTQRQRLRQLAAAG